MTTLTRQTLYLIAGTGVTAALNLAYTIYVGKVLGPDAYAVFVSTLAVIYLCTIPSGPTNSAIARFVAGFAGPDSRGRTLYLVRGLGRFVARWGAVGMVAGIVLAIPLASVLRFPSPRPLQVAMVVAFLSVLLSVFRGWLRGLQDFAGYSVNLAAEAIVRLAAGVAALALVATATSAVTAYVAAVVAVLALSWWQLRPQRRGVVAEAFPIADVKRFTGPMLLFTLGNAAFQNLDMLMVKGMFATHEAGLYAAAITLAKPIGVLFMPFHTLSLPMLSAVRARRQSTWSMLARVAAAYAALAALPIAAFAIAGEAIVALLFGDAYAGAAPLLVPLAVAQVLIHLTILIGQDFAAANRFRFLGIYFAGLVVEVAAIALFARQLGAVPMVVLAAAALTLLAVVARLRVVASRERSGDGG